MMLEGNMRHIEVPYKSRDLKGTIYGIADPRVLFIHGAAVEGSARFGMLRQHLSRVGIASAAFDFIGHGATPGESVGTTLLDRLDQARTVIETLHLLKPFIIVGMSMGADTAIRLATLYPVKTLILIVPAFYPFSAFTAPFGEGFHKAICHEDGWKNSDTWGVLMNFSGSLFVLGAGQDAVIPPKIYDAIDQQTPHVRYKELYIVPESGHRVLPYLSEHIDEFASVFERIYHVIISSSSSV